MGIYLSLDCWRQCFKVSVSGRKDGVSRVHFGRDRERQWTSAGGRLRRKCHERKTAQSAVEDMETGELEAGLQLHGTCTAVDGDGIVRGARQQRTWTVETVYVVGSAGRYLSMAVVIRVDAGRTAHVRTFARRRLSRPRTGRCRSCRVCTVYCTDYKQKASKETLGAVVVVVEVVEAEERGSR